MPEPNKGQSNQILFTVMILLLIVIAGMQTWYIVGIKKQLNVIQSAQTSTQLVEPGIIEKAEETAETDNTLSLSVQKTAADQEKQAAQQTASTDKHIMPDDSSSLPSNAFSNPPYPVQRWDPYQEIERMQRHMERTFNNPYYPYKRPDFRHHFRQDISAPRMDVREDNNRYTVSVNVPGTDAKTLSVDLDGQRLTVRGKQGYEKQDKDESGRIIFSERRSGRFQRSITLSVPVEQKGMQTQINNGVLTIVIPKMK